MNNSIKEKLNYCKWLLRYGIWNWLTDLKWRVPNYFQRGWRGWGNADTWEFDAYLSKIIYQGLVHLNKHKPGYPITLVPENEEEPDYEANEKKWQEIMNKMISAFKLASEIGTGEREFYLSKLNEKHQKELNCLTKEEDDAMNEGFRLFTEHFFNLWD